MLFSKRNLSMTFFMFLVASLTCDIVFETTAEYQDHVNMEILYSKYKLCSSLHVWQNSKLILLVVFLKTMLFHSTLMFGLQRAGNSRFKIHPFFNYLYNYDLNIKTLEKLCEQLNYLKG